MRWIARIVLAGVVIPLLVLGVLEAGLRLSGFGHPTSLFVQRRIDGRDLYIANRYAGRRFFPASLARTPLPEVFPAIKATNTVRIFVFGESAVQGECYRAVSFTRILPVLLRHYWPDTRFEVINCGIAALNSWAIKDYVKECTHYAPDLFILYVGNNEVVGPYGPGTIFAGASAPWLTRIRVWLSGLRLYQLARAVHAWFQPDQGTWKSVSMFTEQVVPSDDPHLATVPGVFAANLERMLVSAAKADVPVMLCTLAANLRSSPPFASCHASGLATNELAAWASAYVAGTNAQALARYGEALAHYQAAAEIDGSHAGLTYRMGQCAFALSNCTEAARHLARARDLDGLRFRPPGELNNRIRSVANGRDTPLLDVAQLVAAEASCAIPGDELLYDHVHFLPEGHYLVASGLCARIVQSGVFAPKLGPPRATATLGFDACMARMGFTARDYQHVAREMLMFFDQEPFIDQLNHGQTMASAAERLIDATHAVEVHSAGFYVTQYMHAVELDPERADLRARLAQALHDAGDVGGCIRELEAALRLNPAMIDETCALAEIYRIAGMYGDALRVLDRALAVDASHAELYHQRGHVHFARGDLEAALRDYEASVRLYPRGVPGYVACGDALRFMGRHAEAIDVYTRGLTYSPEATDLLRRRAQCYAAQGDFSAALGDLERVVAGDPACAAAWHDAAGIYMRMGSNQAAFAAYSHAIEHDEMCTNAFVQRGRLWVDVGEFARAARDFSRALDLDHESGEVYAYRAFARFRAGDYGAALADIRTARQKGYTVKPQFEQAVRAARAAATTPTDPSDHF